MLIAVAACGGGTKVESEPEAAALPCNVETIGAEAWKLVDTEDFTFCVPRSWRVRDGRAEFLLLTLWESEEAIRRFAGPAPEQAVFYPEDGRYLVERGETVDHWEVVHRSEAAEPAAP